MDHWVSVLFLLVGDGRSAHDNVIHVDAGHGISTVLLGLAQKTRLMQSEHLSRTRSQLVLKNLLLAFGRFFTQSESVSKTLSKCGCRGDVLGRRVGQAELARAWTGALLLVVIARVAVNGCGDPPGQGTRSGTATPERALRCDGTA